MNPRRKIPFEHQNVANSTENERFELQKAAKCKEDGTEDQKEQNGKTE